MKKITPAQLHNAIAAICEAYGTVLQEQEERIQLKEIETKSIAQALQRSGREAEDWKKASAVTLEDLEKALDQLKLHALFLAERSLVAEFEEFAAKVGSLAARRSTERASAPDCDGDTRVSPAAS